MTSTAAAPYANNWEHLVAEIGCIELLVRDELERFRRGPQDQRDILRESLSQRPKLATCSRGCRLPPDKLKPPRNGKKQPER